MDSRAKNTRIAGKLTNKDQLDETESRVSRSADSQETQQATWEVPNSSETCLWWIYTAA